MTQTEMTQTGTNPTCAPVLLIEDEPAVMAFVRGVLERRGYEVVTTESGAEALRLLADSNFHGVVSDMRTPGGVDGAQVYAWIATHRPELASRLVFITGDIARFDEDGFLYIEGRLSRFSKIGGEMVPHGTIEQKIIETEPGFRGDTSTNTTKPAKISTGASIQVPLFINEGDRLKVDTRTGNYIERAK